MTFDGLRFYQIVIVLISLSMIYSGVDKFVRRQASQSVLKLFIRLTVWGGMALITLFPDLSDQVAEFIGIEDNINAVILSGFLLVFLLIFKILSVVERIEQEISTLTRKDALAEFNQAAATTKPSVTAAVSVATTPKPTFTPSKRPLPAKQSNIAE